MMSKQAKRKIVAITTEDKLKIIKLLNDHVSYIIISENYKVRISTISDIKKNHHKIQARCRLIEDQL